MSSTAQRLRPAALALFLGHAPHAYKVAVLAALALNVVVWAVAGPAVAGWCIVGEFIVTLALALKCHPLAPGGLLALQAVVLGMTTPQRVYEETQHGLPVILLLLFMVTAIAFMQELLVLVFTRALLALRSRQMLAVAFCATAALLSAFLDALTVMAVIMAVSLGFYRIVFIAASGQPLHDDAHLAHDAHVPPGRQAELAQFRRALRSLLMHAAVGTALGGVCTLVGEPQNLLIAHAIGWDFAAFGRAVAPVSLPVAGAGLLTCLLLEQFRLFGFGAEVPAGVRVLLRERVEREARQRGARERWSLRVQAAVAALLVLALSLHWAEAGLIGLATVVLLSALLGVTQEPRLAEAMKTALPFTALLGVFFAIVAVIHDQQLFRPVVSAVLARHGAAQVAWMYLANGVLSAISDNVFVASVYIDELQRQFAAGQLDAAQFARLAVAVNTGTNLPSVATPNGQAAFLFLLTSLVAPVLRLGYGRMVWMALPYTVMLTLTGLLAVRFLLP